MAGPGGLGHQFDFVPRRDDCVHLQCLLLCRNSELVSTPYGEPEPEPLVVDEDGAQSILFAFDGILHIDDAGVISTSEVLRVYTDLEMMPDLSISGGEREDALFSFHNL